MKKRLFLIPLLCLLTLLTGCGPSYDLFVDSHTWTFETMTETRGGVTTVTECHPALAETYPEAFPLKTELIPYPDEPLRYVLLTGDRDTDRTEWTFAMTDTSRTANVYTVTDTGDGDGNDSVLLLQAVVSTREVDRVTEYTLVVTLREEDFIGTITFTAPMENQGNSE